MNRYSIAYLLAAVIVIALATFVSSASGATPIFRKNFFGSDCSGDWTQIDQSSRNCIRNDDFITGYQYSCNDSGVILRTNWTSYDAGNCVGAITASLVIPPETCLRDPSNGQPFIMVCGLPQLAAPVSVSYHASSGSCGGSKTSINAKCFSENISGSGNYWYELGCSGGRPAVYRYFDRFCNTTLPQGPFWPGSTCYSFPGLGSTSALITCAGSADTAPKASGALSTFAYFNVASLVFSLFAFAL